MLSDFDAVKIARPRQVHFKDPANTSRRGRHDHHSIRQACCLTHIVGDEDDRLAAFLPNLLDIAVELFSCHSIQRSERFVHQQHPRVRCQSSSERHALFHAARELMHVGFHEFFEADQIKKEFCDLAPLAIAQTRFQFQPEHYVTERIEPRKQR